MAFSPSTRILMSVFQMWYIFDCLFDYAVLRTVVSSDYYRKIAGQSFDEEDWGWGAGLREKIKKNRGLRRERSENERKHTSSYDAPNATETADKFAVTLRSYFVLYIFSRRCCSRLAYACATRVLPERRIIQSLPRVFSKFFWIFYFCSRRKSVLTLVW